MLFDKNNGCFGPSPGFYSPDRKYSCNDEMVINNIFKAGGQLNDAQFVREDVPSYMVVGRTYPVAVVVKNSGNSTWTSEQFNLGAQNPPDNALWGRRIKLAPGETVLPGQEKTFAFAVTAPQTPGTFNFQWRMLKENSSWFGEITDNVPISVINAGNPNLP